MLGGKGRKSKYKDGYNKYKKLLIFAQLMLCQDRRSFLLKQGFEYVFGEYKTLEFS